MRKHIKLIFILSILFVFNSCSKDNDSKEPEPEQKEELIDIYIEDTAFKKVGYFPYYRFSSINSIDFSKLNYVNIAFANFDVSGNVVVGNGVDIKNIVNQIKLAGPKVFISIAGGGPSDQQEEKWIQLLSTVNGRETAIHKLLNFVNSNNLDGIDVDIEGALLTDLGNNYNHFIQELKDHLHAENKAITAALNAVNRRDNITATTLRNFDFINIMGYDAKGLWNINDPGPHSSYQFAQNAIDFWMFDQNIDASKLVLGVPFYGVDFDPSVASYFTYSNIILDDPLLAFTDNQDDLYYNGIPTMVRKSQLAFENVNGIMIWELGQDAFNEFSLLQTINNTLHVLPCSGEANVFFKDTDLDGRGDHSMFTVACEQPEGYVGNHDDVDDADANI